jgi:hypothetical protein
VTRGIGGSGLVVPLIVVAVLAGVLGFLVARQIAPAPRPTTARLSVVALPATPTPSPSPTPAAVPGTGIGASGGSSSGGCSPGCQCSRNPAGGIVIICH